eukprot:scaffold43492_cov23-Tisochrysis_lutea.AAC.1
METVEARCTCVGCTEASTGSADIDIPGSELSGTENATRPDWAPLPGQTQWWRLFGAHGTRMLEAQSELFLCCHSRERHDIAVA